jgi:hypothetical protein
MTGCLIPRSRLRRGSERLSARLGCTTNLGAADELTRRFGLRPITVQLLVMHRPFANIESIRNTLGLTAEQYAAISRGSVSTGSRDNVRALTGTGR